MSYTAPTVRATGDLITASIYNTDLVDNIAYLHGDTGDATLAAGVILPNNSKYNGKTTGGTVVPLIQVANDNNAYVNDTGRNLLLRGTAGGVKANGLSVHRHPYSNDRHIEALAPTVTRGGAGTAITFTDAFTSSAPAITLGASANERVYWSSRSATGVTIAMDNSTGSGTAEVDVIVEGPD